MTAHADRESTQNRQTGRNGRQIALTRLAAKVSLLQPFYYGSRHRVDISCPFLLRRQPRPAADRLRLAAPHSLECGTGNRGASGGNPSAPTASRGHDTAVKGAHKAAAHKSSTGDTRQHNEEITKLARKRPPNPTAHAAHAGAACTTTGIHTPTRKFRANALARTCQGTATTPATRVHRSAAHSSGGDIIAGATPFGNAAPSDQATRRQYAYNTNHQ